MGELPVRFMAHTLRVRTKLGTNAYGVELTDEFDMPGTLRAQDQEGATVGVIRSPLAYAERVTPGSLVYLGGHWRTVRAVTVNTDGGLGAWQHVKVEL